MHDLPASRRLGAIYDAAQDPARWDVALDEVCAHLKARACALLVRDTDDLPYDVTALSRAYRDFLAAPEGQHYFDHLRQYEAREWEAFAAQPPQRPFLDEVVGLHRKILDTRPDCISLEHHVGLRRRIGVRLTATPVWFDGMTVGFDSTLAEPPAAAFSKLDILIPHLARAIELSRAFSELRLRYRAVLTVLDRVWVGLVIVLASGEVIVTNKEAERMLDAEDGLSLGRDRKLRVPDPERAGALHTATALGAATARGTASTASTVLTVPRRSGGAPFVLDVSPLADTGCELGQALHAALVTLIDPERTDHLNVARIVRLYRLSPAEAEVCAQLLDGRTTAEIAEIRSTKIVTVKNQLASIFAKSGARTRSELIRLMVRVLPPIG